MTKFRYNYLNNHLWKLDNEYSAEISENNHFRTNYGTFGSDGFILSSDNHWITFTFYPNKIQVFYKQPNKNNEITYFRKDISLTRELTNDELETAIYPGKIEFEFTNLDIVIKDQKGYWISKRN